MLGFCTIRLCFIQRFARNLLRFVSRIGKEVYTMTAKDFARENGITYRQARRVLAGKRTLEHAKEPAKDADRKRIEAIEYRKK